MTDLSMTIETNKVKGFFTYFDQCEPLEELTNEQAGELFKAMVSLFQGKPFEFTDPMVKFAFKFFETTFKRDSEKYVNKCEKMRANVNKRLQKNTIDNLCSQLLSIDNKSTQQPEPEQEEIYINKTSSYSSEKVSDVEGDAVVQSSLLTETGPVKIKKPEVPNCPQDKIIELYHECLPELPQIRSWTGTNSTNLRTRWRERWNEGKYKTLDEGVAYWRSVFVWIHDNCPHLMGQTSGWKMNLAWFVKASNFSKFLNRTYDRQTREVA